ncbi:DUF1158 domain-containing protein [Rosenbergiella australiborealis]|uniref:DUF1158 domain-containing protein n=1 Tax=Rosenbergiella australiborealis TaxID=1544696 RepID=A0ABS5T7H1_9GAMM|nr:DUF1158 domain-containing protein [Rosenbergiella australiborealis]MBT0727470.1 DUF1158 domain-containing protein [Rosenbergiella australiborealis]
MKNPLETLFIPAGILLLGFLSALLLPAPTFGIRVARRIMTSFHLMDINQLYTIVFTLWFLLLGILEYMLIRFVWRRFIQPTSRS